MTFEPWSLRIDGLRTVNVANEHTHWRVRQKRSKTERACVQFAWQQAGRPRVIPPAEVTLTRIAPRKLDPGDGLPCSLKAVRDELAAIAGIDDKHDESIRYVYAQRKDDQPKAYAVEIDVRPMKGAQR